MHYASVANNCIGNNNVTANPLERPCVGRRRDIGQAQNLSQRNDFTNQNPIKLGTKQ